MTKLAKINKWEGKVQAFVKNLLTVNGKNISVPIDLKVNGEVGDTIRITYDDRGFLLTSEIVQKEIPGEKASSGLEPNAPGPMPADMFHEVSRLMVDPQYKNRIIVLETCYKECCQTCRELLIIPDEALDEEQLKEIHRIAVEQAKVDAKALMQAAGEI
jgi:hypothetical protein